MSKRMVVSVPEELHAHVERDMESDKLAGRRPSAAGSLVRLAAVGAARLAAEDAMNSVLDAWTSRHEQRAMAKLRGGGLTMAEALASAHAEMEREGDTYDAAIKLASQEYDRANREALGAAK